METAEAYMNSPEYDDKPPDPRPEMSEDSATVVMLRDIANQLRLLNSSTVGAAGGNPGKIDWLKPPRTAMEMADQRRKRRDHLGLAARLLPHKRAEIEAELSSDP